MSDALCMAIVTAITTIALAFISALKSRPDWTAPPTPRRRGVLPGADELAERIGKTG